jgi:hypothetical protein
MSGRLRAHPDWYLTFIKLVRTGVADCGERFGEIVG